MNALSIRPVVNDDAAPLSELLNAIIVAGGTTALQSPLDPEALAHAYLTGPSTLCCFVAVDGEGSLQGFQTLGRLATLPTDCGDIGTFTRIGGKQRGVGSALFRATRQRASDLRLGAINATIRADNAGGLAFYSKLGFVDHSIEQAVLLKDGMPVDRIHKRFLIQHA